MKWLRRAAISFVLLLYLGSLSAGLLLSTSYETQDREHAAESPGGRWWLGTDDLGRDRFSRLMYGARTSLVLAPAAAMLATGIAAVLGALAGWAGGRTERGTLYLVDVVSSTPWLFALLLVRALLPLNVSPAVSVTITFALLGLLGWPTGVRAIAARTALVVRSDFMLQAQAAGLSPLRQLGIGLKPNLAPVLAAHFWSTLPVFILAEANLSMLGLGVADPLPSLGNLMAEFRDYQAVLNHPWLLAPAVLLVAIIGALQMISKRVGSWHECT